MIPITFASSFGWYHPAAGRCGIVICGAVGHEDLCTHKSLRLIADAFAERGYPSVRFDYEGTGDSLGDDYEPERVEAWIASIEAATLWLRTHTQAETIIFAGLRLGGALAAMAAERLGTISGLLIMAPIVFGRTYIREISALSNLIQKHENWNSTSAPTDVEVGGFIFTQETVRNVSAIDLTALRQAPAPKVLLIAVESQASADRLAKSWRGLGAQVERSVFSHYSDFMLDPAFSRFPVEALENSLNWLSAHFDPGSTDTSLHRSWPYKPHEEDHFSESPVLFGRDQNLFGMMCTPTDFASDRPVVIYLTEGANHHIGWGRLSVLVCRKLAGFGVASMRIDIAAVGDSDEAEPSQKQIVYRDEAPKDVSAAIDWLEVRGYSNITLVGLCAGAHLSFHTALADSRITRIVMVNLQRFIWHPDSSLTVVLREIYRSNSFYIRRLFMFDTWRRLSRNEIKVSGILRALAGRVWKKALASFLSLSSWLDVQTSDEIRRIKDWMTCLDQRKVKQCYVFSLGDAGVHELSLVRPLKNSRRRPHYSVAFIKDADHILSQPAARDRFIDILHQTLCAPKSKMSVNPISNTTMVFQESDERIGSRIFP